MEQIQIPRFIRERSFVGGYYGWLCVVVGPLASYGATLSLGDVGKLSCIATEQKNLNLLKKIILHGGDVTRARSDGYTALHAVVCEGNIEIVKFLLDKGTHIDQKDHHGWTSRDLADQQGHKDIQNLFLTFKFTDDHQFTRPETRTTRADP
ncbi:shaker pollen inward K+ channel [Artemisia annua]|uniref:Shaker pollen inward K+ channel n=1 Tax=Artemisia annua TaxID=35608 RepID=A0A2U1MVE4_ARTAN|nr:shaker pollen inward K+ channel [Artemisia annua]